MPHRTPAWGSVEAGDEAASSARDALCGMARGEAARRHDPESRLGHPSQALRCTCDIAANKSRGQHSQRPHGTHIMSHDIRRLRHCTSQEAQFYRYFLFSNEPRTFDRP